MSATKRPSRRKDAHNGRGLLVVLRKVVPFLFAAPVRKQSFVQRQLVVRAGTKKAVKVIRRRRKIQAGTQKSQHKAVKHPLPRKAARLPATTIEVRKTVVQPVRASQRRQAPPRAAVVLPKQVSFSAANQNVAARRSPSIFDELEDVEVQDVDTGDVAVEWPVTGTRPPVAESVIAEESEEPEPTPENRKTAQADAKRNASADPAVQKAQDVARRLLQRKRHGFFHLPEGKERDDAKRVAAEILAADDSWLKNVVQSKPAGSVAPKQASGWSVLRHRLFGRDPLAGGKKQAVPTVTAEEMEHDTFLRRVEQKRTSSIVGTTVDEEPSALEEFIAPDHKADTTSHTGSRQKAEKEASGSLSASELRKEAKEARAATERLSREVKEIKKEMKEQGHKEEASAPKEPEQKPAEQVPALLPHKNQHPQKNGFQQFIAAIGHLGLGKERMRFTENLATMLKAGLPLIDTLKTLQLETRSGAMRKLLQKMLDSVENGSPLWRAMEEQSFFSLHALALVRIGEEAGNLAENVEYLAAQEEKDHALKGKVKMAMIYPSIVLTLMFVIVMGLGMFVLPNLIGVLYSLNVPLPFVTRMVIIFSNFFTEHGTVAVPSTIGGFLLFVILAKFTPLKVVAQWCMFRIPGIGSLAREATIARFGVILGGLLKAGVPVIEAMQSLVEVTPIVAYRNLYKKMLDHITIGDSFNKSFASIRGSQKLLPPSVQQLVITGEKSGSLSEIMLKIADIYDKKASETAQKLPVILEPMLLIFIGSLVGTIAFAIIIPIYSIVGNVGGQ